MNIENQFTKDAGIKHPIICGPMYPCSNPELVAAASEAGGIGIIQPISLTYVFGYDFREGIKKIRSLTKNPIGLNLLVEGGASSYRKRLENWLEIAIEEDIRFFITALGNPSWVVEKVSQVKGKVYHDVTEEKWAERAIDKGVNGFICVNNKAGGHAGSLQPEKLYNDLKRFNLPLILAGGVSTKKDFQSALDIGYSGVQLGTRFIATLECSAHQDYKTAIINAKAKDIVLTEKLTGVPVAVINTPYIQAIGVKAGWLARKLLKHRKAKHWMRLFYSLKAGLQLKKSLKSGNAYKEYYQAGKSVEGINEVLSVKEVIENLA